MNCDISLRIEAISWFSSCLITQVWVTRVLSVLSIQYVQERFRRSACVVTARKRILFKWVACTRIIVIYWWSYSYRIAIHSVTTQEKKTIIGTRSNAYTLYFKSYNYWLKVGCRYVHILCGERGFTAANSRGGCRRRYDVTVSNIETAPATAQQRASSAARTSSDTATRDVGEYIHFWKYT